MRTRFTLALTGFLLLAQIAATQIADFDGHWEGEIRTPAGALEIAVDLSTDNDGALSGDISIPVQGLRDLALEDVTSDGVSVHFRIPDIPGDPTFDGALTEDGSGITGQFTQGGADLEFSLIRGADQATRAKTTLEGFGQFVNKAIADFNVPGVGLAIVSGGELVLASGFGKRDRENDKPMTADSLFPIGSTTKAMTATVLGTLVDEGTLEWDVPVRTYLPSFALSDEIISSRITPRDLVTHRSGLPRHDFLWYNNQRSTRAEIVERLRHLELSADLRAEFQYNNLLFMTAGFLAGQLTGGTWEAAVRARLFEPLGMTRTNFSVLESQQDPDHALPYREDDDRNLNVIPFRNIDLIGPAGSVNSSVTEMSRWLLLNLRSGKLGDRQLIQPTTLADIHSPHMTTGETPERPDVSQATYGLGWGIDTYRGHRRVAHGGGIDGFITSVMLFPDDDLGLVAFTNVGSGLPALVNQHAADLILGLEPIDWTGEALAELQAGRAVQEEAEAKKGATRVEGTSPSHSLGDYAGDYQHPGYGTLRVELDGETLNLVYNDIRAPLEHWHYDVWNGAETDGDPSFKDSKFLFGSDLDGNVATVESTLEVRTGPIVFERRPDRRLSDPEYLARFVGEYELPGQKVRIELAGSRLTAVVPGQPVYTLEPDLSGRFVLAEARIISLGFESDETGRVTKVIFYQPDGVYEALRVE